MKIPRNFLTVIFIYTVVVFAVFTAIYGAMDFKKHFMAPTLPEGHEPSWDLIMYYGFMIQTGMVGEIAPKTQLGRTVVCLHGFFAWVMTLALLAPWAGIQTVV